MGSDAYRDSKGETTTVLYDPQQSEKGVFDNF